VFHDSALRLQFTTDDAPASACVWTADQVWNGLIAGTFRVKDAFDDGGRRYLILRRIDPAQARALTAAEAEVAERVREGLSNKEIAFELGTATTTVAGRLSRVLRKMGLPSRVSLLRLLPAR
jgi:DNA-binding NarL/FixJ family response regulator